MNRLMSPLIEILAASVFLLPVFLVLNRACFHSLKRTVLYFLFACYLVAVYALVGMPNITYIRFEFRGNLIPFLGMIEDLKNSLLNVLLFLPLGTMLPVFWKEFQGKQTLLFGLGMSGAIELLQIFTLRATDINDLITNGLGTVLGIALAGCLQRVPAVAALEKEGAKKELYLICIVTFGVMFFAQPFVSNILWSMIL